MQTIKNTLYTFVISYEGEEKAKFEHEETGLKAFQFLRKSQIQSTYYALKYGGWKVEVISEETGKSEFWKP